MTEKENHQHNSFSSLVKMISTLKNVYEMF